MTIVTDDLILKIVEKQAGCKFKVLVAGLAKTLKVDDTEIDETALKTQVAGLLAENMLGSLEYKVPNGDDGTKSVLFLLPSEATSVMLGGAADEDAEEDSDEVFPDLSSADTDDDEDDKSETEVETEVIIPESLFTEYAVRSADKVAWASTAEEAQGVYLNFIGHGNKSEVFGVVPLKIQCQLILQNPVSTLTKAEEDSIETPEDQSEE